MPDDAPTGPVPDDLDAVELRILGSLLEKQRTVPDSYPLTLNALRTACNQTSSREPVVELDEGTITDALGRLRTRELVRPVWAHGSSRTLKYHQRLEEALALSAEHRALLTVLVLRGPQSAGELKTRTERLHPFADKDAVEAQLAGMAERTPPLVRQLERRAGHKENRWVHLLGSVDGADEPAPAPAVRRDAVLDAGGAERDRKVQAAYDAAAGGYADALLDELAHKPFDSWLLARIAQGADGPVVDAGCGPGHVAAFLAAHGAAATGVDLSPGMIEQARGRFPALEFEVGDLTRLLRPRDASGWAAVIAWYSLVHLAGSELPDALAALTRVLRPGGVLAFSVHLGDEVRHVDELFGAGVDVEFVLHDPDEVLAAAHASGLEQLEWYRRSPYPDVEVATERMYVLGRLPGP